MVVAEVRWVSGWGFWWRRSGVWGVCEAGTLGRRRRRGRRLILYKIFMIGLVYIKLLEHESKDREARGEEEDGRGKAEEALVYET